MSQQQDRFGNVADACRGQRRLILVDQRDDVSSRNVAVVNDREAGPVELIADIGDLAGRHGRSDRPNVEDIVKPDVVDIARQSSDFLLPFFAENISSDGTRRHR